MRGRELTCLSEPGELQVHRREVQQLNEAMTTFRKASVQLEAAGTEDNWDSWNTARLRCFVLAFGPFTVWLGELDDDGKRAFFDHLTERELHRVDVHVSESFGRLMGGR